MVELLIGPHEHSFLVHKELLCTKIPYFDKMFKGGWEESAQSMAKFPEDQV